LPPNSPCDNISLGGFYGLALGPDFSSSRFLDAKRNEKASTCITCPRNSVDDGPCMGIRTIDNVIILNCFFICNRFYESVVEFSVCMALISYPLGVSLKEGIVKSPILSIASYIERKLPPKWKRIEPNDENEESCEHALLERWR